MGDRLRRLGFPLLSIAVALASSSFETGGEEPRVRSSEAERSPGVEALAWMAGTWSGESDGTTMEEHWLEPRGGLMLGLHRDVSPAGKPFFEFLRIESGAEGPVYLASPAGAPPTPFVLVESGPNRAVFANPEHDYPQRILYWLEQDLLHARIEGKTARGTKASEWIYRRGPLGQRP